MGFEIPIDVNFFDHPKTVMLIGLIGSEADVYPLRLWRWCSMYAKNGVVAGGRTQIEGVLRWKGKAGSLHRALIRAGFLEADGKTVHDFMEGVGRAISLYEGKKQRQRERYAGEILPQTETHSPGSLPEENGRLPARYDKKPNPKKPNSENTNPETVLFDRFWEAYPRVRKQGKGAARKAFDLACRKTVAETIIAAAEEYAESAVGKGQFAKCPTTWLNQECWQDDRTAWNRSDSPKGASNGKPRQDPGIYDPNADSPSSRASDPGTAEIA